ncbi:MAG: isoleucine--tRNA ligase [Rubricella sp.]
MCADTPEYKDTLFLPRTDFPMRAGLPAREPEWLERWARIGIYERLREKTGRTPFTLHDGPPYANGNLHIGHALNKVLKDMVVRSQQMLGRDARYVPGWDCHGLPIEWKIEEQYRAKGKSKDDVPIIELRQECRRFAEGWIDIQREEFKRLGVTGNWDDPYLTMDFHAEAVIARDFLKFLTNGTLYQGSKPVMWSPVEQTALAEAEVEYKDHQSHTIWVRFPVVTPQADLVLDGEDTDFDAQVPSDLLNASIVIWTTTPWTIPQNRAVCFGPEIAYGLYEVTGRPQECWARIGEYVVLADSLAESAFAQARLEPTMYRRLRTVTAAELEALTLGHPFRGAEGAGGEWDFDVPLLPGEHVTDDAGTGFVHTAPSHGDDDYQIGLRHGLPMTYNVLEDGSFRPDLPFFGGKAILKPNGKEGDANGAVIEKLVEVKKLLARGRLKHSYPHSWRSKAPLIYRNTPQWFVAIDKPIEDGLSNYGRTIRERALTSIDTLVKFTPQKGQNRLRSMIEQRPDWVLSRQRAWGVPLTCFVKKGAKPNDADFLLRDEAVNARIVDAFEKEGADCWYEEGAKERFLGGLHDPEAYEQVFDILDVWFDSGSTHAFVLQDRDDGSEDGLADLYLEGTDQHRGWFHSSLLQGSGTIGRAPYRGVLTHGFTLDAKGMKMSKSIGNTIAPQDIIKQYGADILRLWVAQSDYTVDLRIGDEILKGVADSYRRLRNTYRFLLGNLDGFGEAERVSPQDMPELERWVLHRMVEIDRAVRKGYDAYDFEGVVREVFTFCTSDLSAFYFDIRKDALYCDGADSLRRRASRTVLDLLFHRLVTWLAPILVFTMEDVWLSRFPGEDSSVHLQDIPQTPEDWRDDALAARWARIRSVRRVVTGALEIERREKRIGASLEASPIVYLDDPELRALVESVDLADLCITSGIALADGRAPAEAFTLDEVPGVAVTPAPADGAKCSRCWKILPDVGSHSHPETCSRCDAALG